MDIVTFVITVVLVTASGALAPGPLFFATISHGTKSGAKRGLIFAVAHTLVEFSLIMLFALGLLTVASEPIVRQVIGIAGGFVLIAFGVLQIRKTLFPQVKKETKGLPSYSHLFLVGLAFTGLNPYFMVAHRGCSAHRHGVSVCLLDWCSVHVSVSRVDGLPMAYAGGVFCEEGSTYRWITMV